MMTGQEGKGFRSGVAGIVGRPNVGKSTLLNAFLGRKLAIVAPKPQTTRHRIAGILTGADHQVIFLDTPGLHEPRTPLNRAMQEQALGTLAESDLLVMVADAEAEARRADGVSPGSASVIELLRGCSAPVILALNKVDRVAKPTLLPVIAGLSERGHFETIVPISALHRDGLDVLLREIVGRLPGECSLFPDGQLTDRSVAFLVSEFVREQVFLLTQQEVPYSTAVTIDLMEERPGPAPLLHVAAAIHVERNSQKGILVGRGGAMIRAIGTAARQEIQGYLGRKIFLELRVRVEKDWTRSAKGLRKVGFQP